MIHPPGVGGMGIHHDVVTPWGDFTVLTHPESLDFDHAAHRLAMDRVGRHLEYSESHIGKYTGMSVWWTDGRVWILTLLFAIEEMVTEIQYRIGAQMEAALGEDEIWSLIETILTPH
ncbi:MAG: hypothetical protein AAFV53_43560 [Myxococcota bacterium]